MKSKLVKIIALCLAMALLVLCSSVADASTYRFRLTTHYPIGHSALDALDRIVNDLYEKSEGRIRMQTSTSKIISKLNR